MMILEITNENGKIVATRTTFGADDTPVTVCEFPTGDGSLEITASADSWSIVGAVCAELGIPLPSSVDHDDTYIFATWVSDWQAVDG